MDGKDGHFNFSEVLMYAYMFSDDKNAILLVWLKNLWSAAKFICVELIKKGSCG